MKKLIFIFIAFSVIVVNSFGQVAFNELRASLDHIYDFAIQNYEFRSRNCDYYDNGNALFGIKLPARRGISRPIELDAGVQYRFLAGSDGKDKNIQMRIYRGNRVEGVPVARDENISRLAAVNIRFQPTGTGTYTVELINASNLPAFISLLIFQVRPNPNLSLNPLSEAIRNIQVVLDQTNSQNSNIPSENWCLFGRVIPQGDVAQLTGNLSRGNHLLLAAGDTSVNDINALVYELDGPNSEEGRSISVNSGQELRIDFAGFAASPSKLYTYRIENENSMYPTAFVMGFVIGQR